MQHLRGQVLELHKRALPRHVHTVRRPALQHFRRRALLVRRPLQVHTRATHEQRRRFQVPGAFLFYFALLRRILSQLLLRYLKLLSISLRVFVGLLFLLDYEYSSNQLA